MKHYTVHKPEADPQTVNVPDRDAQVGDTVTINPAGITRTIIDILYTPREGNYCVARVREETVGEADIEAARQRTREQQKARRAARNTPAHYDEETAPTPALAPAARADERRILVRVGEAKVGDTIHGHTIRGLGRPWIIDSEENSGVGAMPWETVRVQYAYY